MSKLLSELPKIYQVALMHESERLGKAPLQILIEGLELWFEKGNSSNTQPIEHLPKPSMITQEQTVPICSSQIDIIPISSAFCLLLEQDNGYLLENQKYPTLEIAIMKVQEYEQLGSINFNDWSSITGEYPPVFLQKAKGTPHIWIGQNSICNIFKNQIVKLDGFELSTTYPTQHICKTCVKHYKKLSSPKFHISFDNENNPFPPPIQNFDPLF